MLSLTFVNPCNIIQVAKLDSVLNMGYCGSDYSAVAVFILLAGKTVFSRD